MFIALITDAQGKQLLLFLAQANQRRDDAFARQRGRANDVLRVYHSIKRVGKGGAVHGWRAQAHRRRRRQLREAGRQLLDRALRCIVRSDLAPYRNDFLGREGATKVRVYIGRGVRTELREDRYMVGRVVKQGLLDVGSPATRS